MRRVLAWLTLFVSALIVFLIVMMPAAALVKQAPQLRPGGHPLVLSEPRGRWWGGQVAWRWQQWSGRADWQLRWQGLVPGFDLRITHPQADARGWLGADWGDWQLRDWELAIPVALVASQVPQGNADGQVDISLMRLDLAGEAITDLQGLLRYSGGEVTWGRSGSATVPPLDGRLYMDGAIPTLTVKDPDDVQLFSGVLADQRLEVQVMRAWPQLLGVSQGGEPSDVVFRMSQPFRIKAG